MLLIQKIKTINEIIPGWMKVPFSNILRNRLIRNDVFLKQYKELEKLDTMDDDEMHYEQSQKLKELLWYAYNNSEYYKSIFDKANVSLNGDAPLEALLKVPVITKDILKSNIASIAVPSVVDYYEVSTGGTTGEPTKVYMSRDAIYKEWAFVYHYWSKFGYDFRNSKLATFRGVNIGNKLFEINPLYQEIRMNVFKLNKENIIKYINRIEKYGAEFIYGYPSAIYNYCRLANEVSFNLENKYRAVFLISENLYPYQEELITKTLNCPIAMFYGHSERAVFAEKGDGGYTFNPFYGVTEIREDGQLLVTGFINKKTPLIRYLVDDQVERLEEENPVYLIRGHWDSEVLLGRNGERISAAEMNFHDKTFYGISAYQFVQRTKGDCVLNLVSEKKISDKEKKDIEIIVNKKLGGALVCSANQVDKIELTNRGKYKPILQLINKAED